VRYEMVRAAEMAIRSATPGTALGYDTLGPDEYAVILSGPDDTTLVVVGSPAQLRAALDRLAAVIGRIAD
jgi:hypothetical protein